MTELESKQPLVKPSNKVKLNNYKLSIDNIIYQVSIGMDGEAWCALIGQDLQNGIAGFGGTVQEALRNLADNIES